MRIRNQIAPGTEGGFTTHFPSDDVTSIFDASMRYQADGTPLVVLAGTNMEQVVAEIGPQKEHFFWGKSSYRDLF